MNSEPNIKNRVTGALVLIALMVIFLPLILDGQKKSQILDSKIPEQPIKGEIVLINIEQATRNSASEKKQKDTTAVIQKQSTKPAGKKEPKSTKQPVVEKEQLITVIPNTVILKNKKLRQNRPNFKSSSFVIQLGSFSKETNAMKLITKLKIAGYKAYSKKAKSRGIMIYRVLVGPELKRHQAEIKIAALNKLSGLNAIIIAYDPLRH